jgi:hypothetical protein
VQTMIEHHNPIEMKDISNLAFQTEVRDSLTTVCQLRTIPERSIVGPGFELSKDLLGREAFLVPLGGVQEVLPTWLQRYVVVCKEIAPNVQGNKDERIMELPFIDPQWGSVGIGELIDLDDRQTLIRILLQGFPDDQELEKFEQDIRITLPQPAGALWLFDPWNERKNAFPCLGWQLQENRLSRLHGIDNSIDATMKMVLFPISVFHFKPEPETGISHGLKNCRASEPISRRKDTGYPEQSYT